MAYTDYPATIVGVPSSPGPLPPCSDFDIPPSSPLPPSSDFTLDYAGADSDFNDFGDNTSVIVISDDDDTMAEESGPILTADNHTGSVEDVNVMIGTSNEQGAIQALEMSGIYPFVNSHLMPKWNNYICRLPGMVLSRNKFSATVLTTDYEKVQVILCADRSGQGYPDAKLKRGDYMIFWGKVLESGLTFEMRELQAMEGPNMTTMNSIIEFGHTRGWIEAAIAKYIKQEEDE